MALTYGDEEVLVDYLLRTLEDRLAGRTQERFLNTLPSDQCQLGVLGPRDHRVDDSEADDDEFDKEAGPQPTTVCEARGQAEPGSQEPQDAGSGPGAEPYSKMEDRLRRPPSSLGCEFICAPEPNSPDGLVLSVSVSFAFYTRHLPTLQELREQAGFHHGTASTYYGRPRREPTTTLVEALRRHDVEVAPIRFSLLAATRKTYTDGGVIREALKAKLRTLQEDPTLWREIGRRVVPLKALADDTTYAAFLAGITGSPVLPPISASLRIQAVPTGAGTRVAVYLCNDTPRATANEYLDNYHILGDARLAVRIESGVLKPVELLPMPDDYQYERKVFAVGRNTSVEIDPDRRMIRTQSLARHAQLRMATNDRVSVGPGDLVEHPFESLDRVLQSMQHYARGWKERVIDTNALGLGPQALEACSRDLSAFEVEVDSFASGIAALRSDKRLLTAFTSMNRVFSGLVAKWRIFQVVFIVTEMTALAIREGTASGEWPPGILRGWSDALDRVDVLWFQTGGGKTEAYLGLISCAALYDRLRGKEFGVTAWLRFPLRMLSVQQLKRAARVLWSTEMERRRLSRELGRPLGQPVSLGYLVGGTNTPNRFKDEWSFERLRTDPHRLERLLLVPDCPACAGKETVSLVLDEADRRVRHVCKACGTELPVYVSDEEVMRFLPTLVIGTVDKIAAVAYQPLLAILWRGPQWLCEMPGHGFGVGDWCIEGCPSNPKNSRKKQAGRERLVPYDPSPALHVQDELHLLQEELGTFAGHYETMVRGNEATCSRGLPPKIVAATATIAGYAHQARELYGVRSVRRFPNRGYDRHQSFYASVQTQEGRPDLPKLARVFAAFRPPRLTVADAAALCSEILLTAVNELRSRPDDAVLKLGLGDHMTPDEFGGLMDYYSVTLTYVGSRDRGIKISQVLQSHGAQANRGMRPGDKRDLNVEYLSSHSTLKEIAEVVERLETPPAWTSSEHLDAAVATDVVSHGVDVERINLMVIDRVPEQVASYIQVSSRCARKHLGIVLTILPPYSLRASSIYDRFSEFHNCLDLMVSPVAVNRFAKSAVARTFPGVLLGTIYGRHLDELRGNRSQWLSLVARALSGARPSDVSFDERSLTAEVIESYALGHGVYDTSLENSMRADVVDQMKRFSLNTKNPAYQELVDACPSKPMSSLRDVDLPVPFNPDRQTVNWMTLRWFRLGPRG